MAGSSVNVRVDDNLKIEFDNFAKNVGLTTSSLINLFMKRTVDEQSIPFHIKNVKIPNKTTIKAMEEDLSNTKRYESVDELFADLEKGV